MLGRSVRSMADLAAAVNARLPLASLKLISQEGFTDQEIDRLIIPQRIRRHRAAKNQPLSLDE